MAFFNPPLRPTANPVMQPYPFVIKHSHTETFGAGATTIDLELAQSPIAAIILNYDMLGQGAAAVIASALTQAATIIKVTDGGMDVTPAWSATELYNYNAAWRGSIPPFQDGTAADNKLAYLPLVIPFGRPLAVRAPSFGALFDPLVGFVPKGIPLLHIEYPADGNAIDTRHLKVIPIYYTQRPMYDKRWTSWASQTLATTGAKDWILPSVGQLLEAFLYETSCYNDTLTADAPTLLRWNLTQQGKSLITDGEIPNILGAMLDTSANAEDSYKYIPFVQNTAMDLSLAPRLGTDTRFSAFGGVADALKACFSVVNPV